MIIKVYQNNLKCEEIWICNLYEKNGSIPNGYRPVFVLPNDNNNAFRPIVNVISLTSNTSKRCLPIHVFLWNYECYGLRKPGTLLVEQITTVPADNLDKCIGEIRDRETLTKIYQA